MTRETDDLQLVPGVEGSLSLDAPELAPFRQSIRDWTLFELLKADGLTTFNGVARLSRSELCDLPSIGAQSADDVIELLDRIRAVLPLDLAAPRSELGGSDPDLSLRTGQHDDSDDTEQGPSPVSSPAIEQRSEVAGELPRDSLGRELPGLALIAGRRLSDPLLRAAWLEPGDDLAHAWLARTGAEVVGDLLTLTRNDLLDVRGLGPSKVRRLREYLGRLADAAPAMAIWEEPAAVPPDPDATSMKPRLDVHLETVIAWATSVAGATTWGEALTVSAEAMPEEVGVAWREVLAGDLPTSADESPLTEFLTEDERRARVLIERVASDEPPTLQDLASEFGVSRERVRQIESKGLARLRSKFDSSPEWRTVRWAAERVIARAGAYAPSEVLGRVLPNWDPAERRLVAHLAGYERFDPVLALRGRTLPTAADLPTVAETEFVVDEYEVVERLRALGVHEEHVEFALGSLIGVDRVDGQLVRWGGSIVDKAVAVLEIRDKPQTVEQLIVAACGVGGSRSARNRILEDSRMMRVTKNKMGLRRWGGVHYRGVAELMSERLASGPMDLADLADDLATRYEISPASVRMYAAAPAFKLTGDVIALRSRRDPFVPRNNPWKVRGLYRQPEVPMTVWCVVVDDDMLRGSGRSIPQEIASDLGIGPGDRTEMATTAGPIPLAWSETTHSGPQIGSLRELATGAGAAAGDQLALRFDPMGREMEVRVISARVLGDVVADLVRLTTLPRAYVADPSRLADALGLAPQDLVAALERRGDVEVAALVASLSARSNGGPSRDADRSGEPADGASSIAPVGSLGHGPQGRPSESSRVGESMIVSRHSDVVAAWTAPSHDPVRAVTEDDYERAVTDSLVQMRAAGYEPAALRKLIITVGPVRASQLIAELSEPTEAFLALYRLSRLDLSIEALMCSSSYSDLFAPLLRSRAADRLAEHGFNVSS